MLLSRVLRPAATFAPTRVAPFMLTLAFISTEISPDAASDVFEVRYRQPVATARITASPPEIVTSPVVPVSVHLEVLSAVPSNWSKKMYVASPSLVVVALGLPYQTKSSPAASAPSSRTVNRALLLS